MAIRPTRQISLTNVPGIIWQIGNIQFSFNFIHLNDNYHIGIFHTGGFINNCGWTGRKGKHKGKRTADGYGKHHR